MIPSVTHRCSTARCQTPSSRMGRIRNQGIRRPLTRDGPSLLVLPEVDGAAPGGAGEKLVRVVLPDLARDFSGDDAVVEEELGDTLDRLERQRHVEAGVADGLAGNGLREPGLLRVDLAEALRVGLRDLH